ncbi:hypothetical protein AVEN_67929-1 [Araneus ventricosus]|uniref:Uncharacterized protein n=1 Tax=Araneus ventricosus TaxID=182803 RepID=A0A4Y2QUW1_ARAVE|nr:hypothetical protein AVEN_67929-1 [Araneus ventricosus]
MMSCPQSQSNKTMNIKNSLSNLCDLVGVQFLRRGEADILKTIKDVSWRQFGLRTMAGMRVRSFAVPNYHHTFKVGGSRSCNCIREVSISIDPTGLIEDKSHWFLKDKLPVFLFSV